VSKLKVGLIPAGKPCPFEKRCHMDDRCKRGAVMSKDFSCALARAFDISPKQKEKRR
jgi:hypothetical protein